MRRNIHPVDAVLSDLLAERDHLLIRLSLLADSEPVDEVERDALHQELREMEEAIATRRANPAAGGAAGANPAPSAA